MSTTANSPGFTASPSAQTPQSPPAQAAATVPLSSTGRRLARALYVAELVNGRRVLEIGGDPHSAAFLAQRGARAVLTLSWEGGKTPPELRHERVLLRGVDRRTLLRAGGLGEALRGGSGGPFQSDVIFLSADRALLAAPGLLADLRRVLVKDGQLIVAARSKEARPAGSDDTDDGSVSYFDLIDALESAGLGPVTMLGQSPFLAAAVMPFGAQSPSLVLDDSLATAEPPEEYVALCGKLPAGSSLGKELPYEVVKLPTSALRLPPPVVSAAPPAPPAPPQVQVQVIEKPVEVIKPDPQVVAERDQLRSQVAELRQEQDRLKTRLTEVETSAAQRQQGAASTQQKLEAELQKSQDRLAAAEAEVKKAHADLQAAEAQRADLAERQRLRERTESEHVEAALLHERQMRELKAALDERDAFVAELEEQSRQRPLLDQRLRSAEERAEHSEKAERLARQKLAEVEGHLLRARKELEERTQQAGLAGALDAQRREIEAMRRDALVYKAELERENELLQTRKAELDKAEQALSRQKEQFGQLETVVTRQLAQQKELIDRTEQAKRTEQARSHAEAIAARDASLIAAERKLMQLDQQLDKARAEVKQKDQALREKEAALTDRTAALAAAESKLAATESKLAAAQAAAESAQRAAEASASRSALRSAAPDDGVPMAVGDQPTAPVALSSAVATVSPHEENRSLRKRVTELETEVQSLKDKVTEAERETWRHMKARSDAEQAAAEVREDTVRKLRDARKLASVELTRAMEDATKKAVQLREELSRTEAERKEALGQIKELRAARDAALEQMSLLRQEIDSLRWAAALPEGGAAGSGAGEDAATLRNARSEAERALAEERSARQAAQTIADEAQSRVAELRAAVVSLEQALSEARAQAESEQKRVEALEEEARGLGGSQGGSSAASLELLQIQQDLLQRERNIADLRAERESLGRLLAEVEREAFARSERARQLRVRLAERERELDALRIELSDRERQIATLTQHTPPSEEVTRLQSELQTARRRVADLLDEAALKEQASDEAVSTALRERARAMRAGESLGQVARERDEARDEAKVRAGELEQRLAEVLAESNRLRTELVRLGGSGTVPALDPGSGYEVLDADAEDVTDEIQPLAQGTVQRVRAVGESLGLAPVHVAPGDEVTDPSGQTTTPAPLGGTGQPPRGKE